MAADIEGMQRLGIDTESVIGIHHSQCGFEVWDRLDGLHLDGGKKPSHYNEYLTNKGYEGSNPWQQWANSGESHEGEILSGWLMCHSDRPARVDENDSETTYTTARAIEFMEQAKDDSWCLHVSYIKPHWPYIVPVPYHDRYGPEDVLPVLRSEKELANPHPLLASYHQHRFSKVFCRPGVREKVIPAYMGLIKQIDDQVGRLMTYLERTDQLNNTLIVFTSDHGDYLGDHWLGEKELFHQQSVKIPLILVDPSRQADAVRGTVSNSLVESIDLLPTFLEYYETQVPDHILEGQSLLGILHDKFPISRDYVISEYDYSFRKARSDLNQQVKDCRMIMIFDGRYKLIYVEGYRPMLFDLEKDPNEFEDIGDDDEFTEQRDRLINMIFDWTRQHHNRITISDEQIRQQAGVEFFKGIQIGFWDEEDIKDANAKGFGGN